MNLEAMAAIGREIATQDNRSTNLPIFIVQTRRRIYGLDPQYGDDEFEWVSQDECVPVDAETAKACEAKYKEDGEETNEEHYTHRLCYLDIWENEQTFFTEHGAEEYIRVNGHNLSHPRIYVESLHRNAEMIAVREFLMTCAKEFGR